MNVSERVSAMNEVIGEIAFEYGLRISIRDQVALARFIAYEKRLSVKDVREAAARLGINLGRSTTALLHRVHDYDRRRLSGSSKPEAEKP
jgi:hypothetical protein